MSKDTKQLLRDAAPRPSSAPDFDELWREGRRQRRTGQAAGVLTALAAVGLVVLMVTTVLPASPSGVEVAGQPPTSHPADTADVEVLGKLPSAPASIGHVAAGWADTREGAAALWSEFRLAGSPPELDGRALILAATGESGSCPSELEAVEVHDGRLFLQIVDRPRTSPAAVDSGCTYDFNPITFVLRTDASVLSPPFIVDFGQTSVRVDTPGAVAFADYGERAPDQLVHLDEDEFEVLAAAATKDPSLKGHVFRDVDGAAALWQMADVQGSAPTLPDGTVGVFVIARDAESTCRSPQDVIGVEIVDRVAVVILDPDGEFLRPCPGPNGAAAWTAFAVAIPERYVDALTGADARLADTSGREPPADGHNWVDDDAKEEWDDEHGPGTWIVGYFLPPDFTYDTFDDGQLVRRWRLIAADERDLERAVLLAESLAALPDAAPAEVDNSWQPYPGSPARRLDLEEVHLDEGDELVLDFSELQASAPGTTAGMAMGLQFDAIVTHYYPEAESICVLVDGEPSSWLHDMMTCPSRQ